MFAASRRTAWTAAAVAALAAGAAVAHGIEPLGPRLELHLSPMATRADVQYYELRATPRGGESIPVVRLEVVSGDVVVRGRKLFFDLQPDTAARFELRILRSAAEDPVVRVVQGGHVNAQYEIALPVDRN